MPNKESLRQRVSMLEAKFQTLELEVHQRKLKRQGRKAAKRDFALSFESPHHQMKSLKQIPSKETRSYNNSVPQLTEAQISLSKAQPLQPNREEGLQEDLLRIFFKDFSVLHELSADDSFLTLFSPALLQLETLIQSQERDNGTKPSQELKRSAQPIYAIIVHPQEYPRADGSPSHFLPIDYNLMKETFTHSLREGFVLTVAEVYGRQGFMYVSMGDISHMFGGILPPKDLKIGAIDLSLLAIERGAPQIVQEVLVNDDSDVIFRVKTFSSESGGYYTRISPDRYVKESSDEDHS